MTAAIVIAGLVLAFAGTLWLIHHDRATYPKNLDQARRAWDAWERDLAILEDREQPHASYAFPPATRGPYIRQTCGCIEFADGEQVLCSPHKIDAEMDEWPM